MRGLRIIAALALAVGSAAYAQTAEEVHEAERQRFGFTELRQGASGNPQDANAANSDEAKVGSYGLPPLQDRPKLARLVEDNWVGRIPESVARFRIEWEKAPVVRADMVDYAERAWVEDWRGRVVAPDGRSGPFIDATIYFPKAVKTAPALVSYTYIWPGGRTPNFGGPPPPDAIAQALDHGWAYVAYRPQSLQADTAARMQQGVIGLARWPREKTDWGALRAWAWGASQLREELAKNPRIAGDRISLTGHSRFGKGVLVAAAFDPEFADAHVSSSGAGGAKLMRRDFGERWENMAGSGAFHWYAPNILFYAQEGKSVAELPVDAHSLIALRAPHPLFVTSGRADKGDAWVDPTGMWQATMAAEPAWALVGQPVPSGDMPAPLDTSQARYPLGWYQHDEGHVPWPAYEAFYAHAEKFAPKR
jgi:hypothetical protein